MVLFWASWWRCYIRAGVCVLLERRKYPFMIQFDFRDQGQTIEDYANVLTSQRLRTSTF